MSDRRNLATPISIAVAVVCAAWALYATSHRGPSGGGPPPGGGGGRNAPPAATLHVLKGRVTLKGGDQVVTKVAPGEDAWTESRHAFRIPAPAEV